MEEQLIVDGIGVRFVPSEGDALAVFADGAEVGAIAPVSGGDGYRAFGVDGEPLTRASQWGGRVSARFGSKELAVRALLSVPRA